jgi:D-tyrosyl-tRNA(Tyr) deacylase
VDGTVLGQVGTGLLALVGVTHHDTADTAAVLAAKLYTLRILRASGENTRGAKVSLAEAPGAAVLVVSQFTVYGSTRKGRRPSWSAAAPGRLAEPLIDRVVAQLRTSGVTVATGRFGADMTITAEFDGPVTVLVDV